MAKCYVLSDEAWTGVADLFTETHGRGQPRLSDRLMLDGVLWVLCSGAAWRDMPERFGPWSTVYQRSIKGFHNSWSGAVSGQLILDLVQVYPASDSAFVCA